LSKRLLLDMGADARAAAADGTTSLHAARSEDTVWAVSRLLLVRGADVDARDGEGCAALVLAGKGGHKDVVRLLLEAARR
jgi:ankyrin repeat protein